MNETETQPLEPEAILDDLEAANEVPPEVTPLTDGTEDSAVDTPPRPADDFKQGSTFITDMDEVLADEDPNPVDLHEEEPVMVKIVEPTAEPRPITARTKAEMEAGREALRRRNAV